MQEIYSVFKGMKLFGKISSILFVALFLVTSTGVVIFKSHCSCFDTEQLSIYVSPDSCDEIHADGKDQESCSDSCCSPYSAQAEDRCCSQGCDQNDSCDCDSPETFYFKLQDQVQEEIHYLVPEVPVLAVKLICLDNELEHGSMLVKDDCEFPDPPPLVLSGQKYIIEIQCIKIPSVA